MKFLILAAAIAIPAENQSKGEMPGVEPAVEMAKRLLAAVQADDPKAVADDFFPAEPFDALKAIAKPGDYYAQLRKWYEDDVHKEHARIKDLGPLTFDGFRAGGCKWKAKGTEANSIPYWSCYSNRYFAKTAAGKKVDFGLRAMINWGKTWYVTHLLPLPK
jgi:hypothetical protein